MLIDESSNHRLRRQIYRNQIYLLHLLASRWVSKQHFNRTTNYVLDTLVLDIIVVGDDRNGQTGETEAFAITFRIIGKYRIDSEQKFGFRMPCVCARIPESFSHIFSCLLLVEHSQNTFILSSIALKNIFNAIFSCFFPFHFFIRTFMQCIRTVIQP